MLKIVLVAGARPNFMKIAPILKVMQEHSDDIDPILVHTGQHYDIDMSQTFFKDLNLPTPEINLEVGSGSHAQQTGRIMIEFEKILIQKKPDLVIVVGDVNSTLACAITAKKLGIKVGHVEAGLRSRDMTMPEEINRLCTDVLCDYLFTTDKIASQNLIAEGIDKDRIYFVGNVMIDTLMEHRAVADKCEILRELDLVTKKYVLVTLHRPANVDDPDNLKNIIEALANLSKNLPVIFPAHPRTRKQIEKLGPLDLFSNSQNFHLLQPLSYIPFLNLMMNARVVLTDSGGIQEETTALGIPCLTMRENTERPITCTQGTNVLVGSDPGKIKRQVFEKFSDPIAEASIPEKWDGHAAKRIVKILRALD